MKYYELTYIISQNLTEEEIETLSAKITAFIQKENGVLGKIIKSSNGKMATLDFHLNPEKLENLEKKIKSEKQILRYMILNKKILKKIPVKKKPALASLPKAEKVELEEIDKKIDEILRE